MVLDLIAYNKSSDSYTFKLTLGPGIDCGNDGKGPYKRIKTARIYFADNNESLIIQDKLNRITYDKRNDTIYTYPDLKIDQSNMRPFMLTVVKPQPDSRDLYMERLNKLILTVQHDIPVTIFFD